MAWVVEKGPPFGVGLFVYLKKKFLDGTDVLLYTLTEYQPVLKRLIREIGRPGEI